MLRRRAPKLQLTQLLDTAQRMWADTFPEGYSILAQWMVGKVDAVWNPKLLRMMMIRVY